MAKNLMSEPVQIIEEITPVKAAEYLKQNTNNYRKLQRSVVRGYSEDMKNDKWQLTGVPIVFGKDGVLKDGQHRLAAIIMSKKTIKMAVVKDVDNNVDMFDMGMRRTTTQIVNAEGFDADSTVVAAANIIVNQFQHNRGNTRVIDYVRNHIDELNRAMRVTCYGTGPKSKNAPSVCATYLFLRTKRMPHYEAELFFRLMNDFGFTCADGYEVSPALIAQHMFDERGTKHAGRQIQKERLEILVMAMQDFHDGKKRENKYKISEPFHFTKILNEVRKMDGLED